MINHGLINKIYFRIVDKTKAEKIYDKHPDFIKYKAYFMRHYNRSRHYVAIKYHVMQLIEKAEPEINQVQLSDILNLHDRSTISYYKNKYKPLNDHDEFIEQHFEYCIENFYYPKELIYDRDIKKYGKFKLVHYPEKNEDAKEKKVYVGRKTDNIKNAKQKKQKNNKYQH